MQHGHSKDHRPDLPQLKLMAAAAEPTGQLIASDVVSGQSADDSLYTPLLRRVRTLLGRRGLLYSGDCKMAARAIRADIVAHGDLYLTALPHTGETAREFDGWVNAVVADSGTRTRARSAHRRVGGSHDDGDALSRTGASWRATRDVHRDAGALCDSLRPAQRVCDYGASPSVGLARASDQCASGTIDDGASRRALLWRRGFGA